MYYYMSDQAKSPTDPAKITIQKCAKVGDDVDEFKGRVKVILVDPPEEQYFKRTWEASFITLANMMIGVNTVMIVLFALGFKINNYAIGHIVLCTVGCQFCMPLGILMVNSFYGPAVPTKKCQRRTDHMLLHLLGLCLTAVGVSFTIMVQFEKAKIMSKQFDIMSLMTPHCISGLVAVGVAVLNILSGLILKCKKKELKSPGCIGLTHRFLGIIAFLSSSTCFIIGILTPDLQSWLFVSGYIAPIHLMVFFTIFYTLVILSGPGSKFSPKSKE